MAWENIEERLIQPFVLKVPHSEGVLWYPASYMEIDEWLTSIAQTDEEFKELNIRRIRFLQNRWPIEKLLQLEWDGLSSRRAVLAMFVGRRAYILFQNGFFFDVVGAVEPKEKPALYQAMIERALRDPHFVSTPPKRIRIRRPDLIPDTVLEPVQHHHEAFTTYQPRSAGRRSYLGELLVGWLGNWIDLPVLGYWHQDESESEQDIEGKKAA